MSRASALILMGILVILAPFAGLPSSWLSVILPILGAITTAMGFMIRSERVRKEKENGPSVLA